MNMKLRFFAVMLLFSFFNISVFAQDMWPKYNIVGGNEGKNYAVIISTKLPKKQLIERTVESLEKYGILKRSDVKIDEISDAMSEYTMPFVLRQCQTKAKGMLGASYVEGPMKLYGNLRFEFYENGKALICYQDFYNQVLALLINNFSDSKSGAGEDYGREYAACMMSSGIISKFLVWANKGLDGMADFYKELDDYFADIDSKYKVYERMIAGGDAEWMTGEEYAEFLTKKTHPGAKTRAEKTKECVEKGILLAITDGRWRKDIVPCFDKLFIRISNSLGGEIIGVAEDGNQIWTLIDGKVLPTDPKLQKKYIKKKLTYFNQE